MFEGGTVIQTVVEMEDGVLVVMSISHGAVLAVLAAPDSKMGLVAYEMTLSGRAGRTDDHPAPRHPDHLRGHRTAAADRPPRPTA